MGRPWHEVEDNCGYHRVRSCSAGRSHAFPRCPPLSNPPLSCRPAGWAPAIPRKTPFRLFFAKTRVAVPYECNRWLRQTGQVPASNFNGAVEFCVSLLDKVAFCGGDSGGALYTIGRSGGKATAFVHGIFTVRHGCCSSALGGGQAAGAVRAGVETWMSWADPSASRGAGCTDGRPN